MVSLLTTKFHEILFSSFRGVALTNCVTDRQTDGRMDGQTDGTRTICLPTKVWGGGRDIIKITIEIFTGYVQLPAQLQVEVLLNFFLRISLDNINLKALDFLDYLGAIYFILKDCKKKKH